MKFEQIMNNMGKNVSPTKIKTIREYLEDGVPIGTILITECGSMFLVICSDHITNISSINNRAALCLKNQNGDFKGYVTYNFLMHSVVEVRRSDQ